jgi:hypothetical protein
MLSRFYTTIKSTKPDLLHAKKHQKKKNENREHANVEDEIRVHRIENKKD